MLHSDTTFHFSGHRCGVSPAVKREVQFPEEEAVTRGGTPGSSAELAAAGVRDGPGTLQG